MFNLHSPCTILYPLRAYALRIVAPLSWTGVGCVAELFCHAFLYHTEPISKANIGIGDLRQAIEDSKRQPNLPYSLKAPLLSRSTTASEQAATIAARLAALPASLTTLILGMVDAPAYSDLTTSYCNDIFNPSTPARPGVRYFSVAARLEKMRYTFTRQLACALIAHYACHLVSSTLYGSPRSYLTRRSWLNGRHSKAQELYLTLRENGVTTAS